MKTHHKITLDSNILSGLPALSMRVAIKDSAAGMAFRHQKNCPKISAESAGV